MNISSTFINQIYLRCLLRNKEVSYGGITVPGLLSGAHTFHQERLQSEYSSIFSAIKKLPRKMLHSNNPAGLPWIIARSHGSGYDGCTLETAERLVVMGIALGIVRIVRTEQPVMDIPNIVIDDDRLIREEKMRPKNRQRRQVARWKR